jgi:hypothetical protein
VTILADLNVPLGRSTPVDVLARIEELERLLRQIRMALDPKETNHRIGA